MFNLIQSDPEILWLNVTNAVLGVVTLICIGVVAAGISREVLARRKSNAVDREARRLVERYESQLRDTHAFDVPELGLTMADGGEPADHHKKEER